MRYTLVDLIEVYAAYEDIDIEEAQTAYNGGTLSKVDLLEAYLHNEGIFGYTSSIWSIFEALKD